MLLVLGMTFAMAAGGSELEATHQELDRTATAYQLLFREQPEAAWVLDLGTLRFIEVNDAACRRYGYSRDEYLAMTIMDISVGGGPPKPAILYLEQSGLRHHRKKDGTVIEVLILIHDVNYRGQRSRYVMAQDITNGRKTQPQVKQAQPTET